MIVRQFLEWMETASVERRAEAAHAMARAFLHSEVEATVRDGMEAALTVLLDDPAIEVRYALADVFAADPRAPRHIILTLAGDQFDIAGLILSCSPVLIDGELVDIVAAADGARQAAVASRLPLSASVAAAVAEVGEVEACRALLDNPDAAIASISLVRLADRFGEDAAIRDRLLARRDLPADSRQRLIRDVSDRLGALVSGRDWIAPERARRVTREACERATISIAAETAEAELAPLAEHLRVTGQLTTALLLRAICAGNAAFLGAALAILARMPERRVMAILAGGRNPALRAIFGRAGLPSSAHGAFIAAIDVVRDSEASGSTNSRLSLARRTVEAVLARYDEMTAGESGELAAMLRRFAAEEARAGARAIAQSYSSAA
ncbi:hypothetical protein C3941_19350 [Kaistia algarum]|uniref:DUF2336 domain-containing protein n=1 Tax=Kaistia algarum TaxID=2083279 RepID=UPI000CE75022|nr:DUF2336 domain-containing protein [Kaistia algarum]MCX5516151.1 DUF2336 domain-containing protein [Kaistia algarum]PPE78224.1 hypothetical protein C3941_19350 [Kaistia algarum]